MNIKARSFYLFTSLFSMLFCKSSNWKQYVKRPEICFNLFQTGEKNGSAVDLSVCDSNIKCINSESQAPTIFSKCLFMSI